MDVRRREQKVRPVAVQLGGARVQRFLEEELQRRLKA